MTKRHCFVTDVGDAIEALASALDPEREPPFKGDILDLLEWATKDVLEMRQQLTPLGEFCETLKERIVGLENELNHEKAVSSRTEIVKSLSEQNESLRKQLTNKDRQVVMLHSCLKRWAFTHSKDECDHMEVAEALAATGGK